MLDVSALPVLPPARFATSSQVRLALQLDKDAIREALERSGYPDVDNEIQGVRFVGFNVAGQFVYETLNHKKGFGEDMFVGQVFVNIQPDNEGVFTYFAEY